MPGGYRIAFSAGEVSPRSGRSKIAQRFIAGLGVVSIHESVQRTAEVIGKAIGQVSAVRFTDYFLLGLLNPSTEVLGYSQASASRTLNPQSAS
jgi:hypothetical protein